MFFSLDNILDKEEAGGNELKEKGKRLCKKLARPAAFLSSAVGLGFFDFYNGGSAFMQGIWDKTADVLKNIIPTSLSGYIPLGDPQVLYQFVLLSVDFALTGATLYHRKWGKKRNSTNFIMAPAHSVIMDYTSASLGSHKLLSYLPKAEYLWRFNVFDGTQWNHLISVINSPSLLIPHFIMGYDIAVYAATAYLLTQAVLDRRRRHTGESKPVHKETPNTNQKSADLAYVEH